jgi:hypothetical protein
MTSVKRLLFSLVLILVAANFSLAQVNRNYDGTRPEVVQGAKSFVFMYAPFVDNRFHELNAGSVTVPVGFNPMTSTGFDFDNVPLQGIGFRYYVSNQWSLQLGLHFGNRTLKDTTSAGNVDRQKLTTFGAALDANYHMPALYSVSPYVGVNLNFGTLTYDDTQPNIYTYRYTSNAFGAAANIGFDWYFTPGLSLGGKYMIGFTNYSRPTITLTGPGGSPITPAERGPHGTFFGTNSASILLNVHF